MRDDPRQYGTEREHITRTPEDPFFKKYAAEASRCGNPARSPPAVYCPSGLWQLRTRLCAWLCVPCRLLRVAHPSPDTQGLNAAVMTHNLCQQRGLASHNAYTHCAACCRSPGLIWYHI